ncbi:tetratricopeptide repeat protein [Streptomyces sp. 7-21]|nr:tetratricopeptide repeat protein [Streptomyces sp. 7-21]
MAGVEFRVLGPIEVRAAGREVRVPAGQQRSLLASLLVDAGRVVPAETLGAHLWGDARHDRTSSPVTLRTYVSRLRTTLAKADPAREFVRYRPPGYLLDAAPGEVDLLRFRELAARARGSGRDDRARADLLGQALALWRGEPLADVTSETLRRDAAAALTEERLRAVEERAAARLALGEHAETAGDLAGYARAHPLRERLQALLMRALYGCGRQAEALAHYQRTRRLLDEELGVSPGPELERVYLSILREEPVPPPGEASGGGRSGPARPVPAELPRDPQRFTGRTAELAWLRSALGQAGGSPAVIVLAGAAGVGKTALAVHAAHRLRAGYPDGQLFVDLRGHESEALPPAEALRRFLRALGEPEGRLPDGLDERAARFRSVVADRRLLVVLDNAATAAQVRPLLPGSPGSLVLVTSRRRLDGLIALDGAQQLSLEVLGDADATALLRAAVGASLAGGQDEELRALARLCDGLPLALRIAAARLLAHPNRPAGWLVEELSSEQRRLARLALAGDEQAAVPTAFSSAYEALEPRDARVYRLLGLHPLPELSAGAVAALAGGTVASVQPSLDALVAAHLAQETGPGRYVLHDLVHLYARQRAEADEPREGREAAIARMLDFYLATGDAAGRPHQAYYPPPQREVAHPPADPPPFATPAEGLAWMTAEYPAVLAATRLAARRGDHRRTWQLADVLWFLQHRRRQYDDWIELHRLGLAAGRALGHTLAVQRMLRRLGSAFAETRRFAEASQCYDEALALARESGDRRTETTVLNNLGVLCQEMGELEREEGYLSQAVELARAHGFPELEAMGLANLAFCYIDMNRPEEAVAHAQEGLRIHQSLPEASPRASAFGILGKAQRLAGRWEESLASYREGLAVAERTGASYMRAECLDGIGLALAHLSGPEAGLPYLDRALELFESTGHRRASDVRASLARLRGQASGANSTARV